MHSVLSFKTLKTNESAAVLYTFSAAKNKMRRNTESRLDSSAKRLLCIENIRKKSLPAKNCYSKL